MTLPDQTPYFNRDLSWLKFNERVPFQAQDIRIPVLERVRFLVIYSSNLDEFFMKRVGYLKRAAVRTGVPVGTDILPAEKLLGEIRQVIQKQIQSRHECYLKVQNELNKSGIAFVKWEELSEDERKLATEYFHSKVFPVLTPLAVDKSHPFPFLSNLSVSLWIVLVHPRKKEHYYARVKIP